MRTLTDTELSFVSGGAMDKPPSGTGKESLWDQFVDWLDSWFDGWSGGDSSSGTSGTITLTASDIGQFQRDCLEAGGDFTLQSTNAGADISVQVVDVNGDVTNLYMNCEVN